VVVLFSQPVYATKFNKLTGYKDARMPDVPPLEYNLADNNSRHDFTFAALTAVDMLDEYAVSEGAVPPFRLKCHGSGPKGYLVTSDKTWAAVISTIFKLSSGRRNITVILHKGSMKDLYKGSVCLPLFLFTKLHIDLPLATP
jgi:hypothetical protein